MPPPFDKFLKGCCKEGKSIMHNVMSRVEKKNLMLVEMLIINKIQTYILRKTNGLILRDTIKGLLHTNSC